MNNRNEIPAPKGLIFCFCSQSNKLGNYQSADEQGNFLWGEGCTIRKTDLSEGTGWSWVEGSGKKNHITQCFSLNRVHLKRSVNSGKL